MMNILISYAYIKPDFIKTLKAADVPIRLLLDSGAFTSWSTGKVIDLGDYSRFVKDATEEGWLWKYFTLDVIGDHEATYKNWKYMLDLGLNPIPIFTPGTPEKRLDEFYQYSDIVGFGGINAFRGRQKDGYIAYAMKISKGRKVHLLGMTTMDKIFHYKPFMCDSSTWAEGPKFGRIKMYLDGKKSLEIKRTDFTKKPSQDIMNLLKWYEINPFDLAEMTGWNHNFSPSRHLSIRSWLVRSMQIEKNLETLIFNAIGDRSQLEMFIEAYKRMSKKGRPKI